MAVNLMAVLNVVMPILIFVGVSCLSHFLTAKIASWLPQSKVEPWLYEPIAAEHLPARQRTYFERYTGEIQGLGYRPLGDFVMKRSRWSLSCSRFFMSRDGEVLVALDHWHPVKGISAVSLMADGRYVEVSTHACIPEVPADIPMLLANVREHSPSAVLEAQEHHVAEYSEAADTFALPMTADDYREVLNYGHRLIARLMHREGVLPEVPEFAREKAIGGEVARVQ
jgi:hypothetical protein